MEKTLSAAASFVPPPPFPLLRRRRRGQRRLERERGGKGAKLDSRRRRRRRRGPLPPSVYSSWAIACQRKRGKEGRGEVSCPPPLSNGRGVARGSPLRLRLAAAVLQHRDGGGGLVQPRHRTYTGTEKEELLRLLSLVSTPCAQAPTDGPSSECRKRERRKETKWEEE